MIRELAQFNDILAWSLRITRDCVEDLPEQAVNWVPDGMVNSIGGIAEHSCGTARWIVGNRVFRDEQYERRPIDNKPTTKDAVLATIDDVKLLYDQLLERVTEEALDEERPFGKGTLTVRQLLSFSLLHFSHHGGQIRLLARAWRTIHPDADRTP